MARCTFVDEHGVRCIGNAGKKTYCKAHRESERTIIRNMGAELNRYAQTGGTTDLSPQHVGANPISGYLWELRRTASKIMACEEQIAQLTNRDIVWGRTLEETKDAALSYNNAGDPIDNSYTLIRDQAQLNRWVELLLIERKHYAALCNMGIRAGLENKRIEAEERTVLALQRVITNVLNAAGLDPQDPTLRATIREELIAVDAGEA